jgi:hypothetical protein
MRIRDPVRSTLVALLVILPHWTAAQDDRIHLTFDPSEAEAAIAILTAETQHRPVPASAWTALFATQPYQWLKARETAFHRPFTDDSFEVFLRAPTTVARLGEFEETLTAWKRADMVAIGRRSLAYLPADAVITAKVFPEIKPRTNSFVWGKEGEERAIFLYLGHTTQAQFENTVAHESHHIGFASIEPRQDSLFAGASSTVKQVLKWLGAFGEGHAMLAAAGGPRVHPHWEDDSAARARWDADMEHFSGDLLELQEFFTDILDGRIVGDSAIQARGLTYFRYQGPWYTVGYKMDVLIEERFGRPALIAGMVDPRVLLVLYDRAARAEIAAGGEHLSLWSPEFLSRIGASDALADAALASTRSSPPGGSG